MNRPFRILTSVLIVSLAFLPASRLSADDKNLADIYEDINRVMVTVDYKAEMTFMGQSDDIEGRVPGMAVMPRGMIIFDGTSLGAGSHFGSDAIGAPRVEKPKSLKVTDYKGDTYEAEFIGVDQFTSIGFCRLPDSSRDAIEPARFSHSELKLGEEIIVFWLLPEGFEPRFQMARSLVTNILEKPEKYYLTGELTVDFLMTPVVKTDGQLAGIIVPFNRSGRASANFDAGETYGDPVGVMPVEKFEELLAKPPAPEEFQRGWLGIALQALDPEVAEFWDVDVPGGIVVSDVIRNSPAELSGLEPGDFIVGLNGQPIDISDDANLTVFQKSISELGAGGKMDFLVVRPGEETVDSLDIEVVLAERPISAGDAEAYEDTDFDMTVREMVFSDYNSRNLEPDEVSGVVIDKLEQGGWAAVDGLRIGDIILKINDRDITSVSEARAVLEDIEKDKKKEAVFMVWRHNKTYFLNIKTHWQ